MNTGPSWLTTKLLTGHRVPDAAVRVGIRRLISARLRAQRAGSVECSSARRRALVERRSTGPIALPGAPDDLPRAFYRAVLGGQLKYSAACWDVATPTLDAAEERMLVLTAERADLRDGQRILDLGCGWGALALWLARRFPDARITAVSNAPAHTAWIDAQARREGLAPLEIITADMNAFDTTARFDRIVSIEMFEHMRNWRALLGRVARWLDDDGQLFLQMLTRDDASLSEMDDAPDVISAYFFGGLLPPSGLLYELQGDLEVRDRWTLSGRHGRQTAEAWLANMTRREPEVVRVLTGTFGAGEGRRRFANGRLFLMACAELWDWRGGEEWLVSHYALSKGARTRKGVIGS